MFLSQEEFDSIMRKNPSLKIAKSSPTSTFPKKYEKGEDRLLIPEQQREKTKYRNCKVYIFEDGTVITKNGNKKPEDTRHGRITDKYDSVREYERAQELKQLEKAGKIKNLERQVKFILQPAFCYNGEKIQAISYVADFQYEENGQQIIEDVKGRDKKTGTIIKTEKFDMKWKMMKYQFPNYIFKIVGF